MKNLSSKHLAIAGLGPPLLVVLVSMVWGIGLETAPYLPFLLLVWAAAFGSLSWSRLDEPSKEAQKFAASHAYAASFLGGGLVFLLIGVIPNSASDALQGIIDGYRAILAPKIDTWDAGIIGLFLGIGLAILLQGFLFLFLWIVWWTRVHLMPIQE